MTNDVLKFYEDLTPEQIKAFNERLLSAMQNIRDEVTEKKEINQMATRDEILQRHAEQAAQEIADEEAKGSRERARDAQVAELQKKYNGILANMEDALKQPSKNLHSLEALNSEAKKVDDQLRQLGVTSESTNVEGGLRADGILIRGVE